MKSTHGELAATVKADDGDANSGLTRRTWLKLTAGATAATMTGPFSSAWGQTPQGAADTGASKAMFKNPLFAGDYSDPTIRGEYYYLICAEGGTAGPPTKSYGRGGAANRRWDLGKTRRIIR